MLKLRKSEDRGLANHGWLKSRHTFSFGGYYDPKHMGFRSLRVINEDRIAGGQGFDKHPHRDMEIISYVVKGSLRHEDTMGNKTVILPGEVQKLSAGTGMFHSEMNNLLGEETHFFQIWILPSQSGGVPSYGQKSFAEALAKKNLVLTISGDGRDGSIAIKQDADLYLSRLAAREELEFQLRPKRGLWVQMIAGRLTVNDQTLVSGDGLSLEEPGILKLKGVEAAELMIFDLA